MKNFTIDQLQSMLDIDCSFFEKNLLKDLKFRRLERTERDVVILDILKKINDPTLIQAGKNDPSRWEKGWEEILNVVKHEGVTLENLSPQYFHYNIIRLLNDFAVVSHKNFEYELYNIIRKLLFHHYLSDIDSIVDFGCGTGTNLYLLAELFPQKKLAGCDWASSSIEILKAISNKKNKDISGIMFNMLTLEGKDEIPIEPNQAFLTTHSLEQLGDNYKIFLKFIISRKPSICLHIEPILELYNSENMFDYLAIKFHQRKNYLSGFLPELERLESLQEIKILKKKRLHLGSKFHDGYSLIVWKPLS